MRLSTKQLLIVVNPFVAPLAVDGRAIALCAVDPTEPMGSQYIGARTEAKAIKLSPEQAKRRKGPFGPRDKVSVVYALKAVPVADTSYYRQKIAAGDLFEGAGDASFALVVAAARAAIVQHVTEGGSREDALVSWRAQGLAVVADVIAPPVAVTPPDGIPVTLAPAHAKLPPGDDTLKESPGIGEPMTPIEVKPGDVATLTTKGAVS
jgi:hypothetical protein